jgi:hypothetical protein
MGIAPLPRLSGAASQARPARKPLPPHPTSPPQTLPPTPPVVSMTMWSNSLRRCHRLLSAATRSSLTVQQRQPLDSTVMESPVPSSTCRVRRAGGFGAARAARGLGSGGGRRRLSAARPSSRLARRRATAAAAKPPRARVPAPSGPGCLPASASAALGPLPPAPRPPRWARPGCPESPCATPPAAFCPMQPPARRAYAGPPQGGARRGAVPPRGGGAAMLPARPPPCGRRARCRCRSPQTRSQSLREAEGTAGPASAWQVQAPMQRGGGGSARASGAPRRARIPAMRLPCGCVRM